MPLMILRSTNFRFVSYKQKIFNFQQRNKFLTRIHLLGLLRSQIFQQRILGFMRNKISLRSTSTSTTSWPSCLIEQVSCFNSVYSQDRLGMESTTHLNSDKKSLKLFLKPLTRDPHILLNILTFLSPNHKRNLLEKIKVVRSKVAYE